MELTSILIKPYHTEKSNKLRLLQEKSCMSFIVDKRATKNQIELAFKAIYNVTPLKINVLNRKSQSFRNGTKFPGRTKEFKLAYIILPKGVSIALTKAEIEEASKEKEVKKDKKELKKQANETNVEILNEIKDEEKVKDR